MVGPGLGGIVEMDETDIEKRALWRIGVPGTHLFEVYLCPMMIGDMWIETMMTAN